MPNILANIAKMDSATTGTGTLTLGAAVTGYLTFANAGVTNGQVVTYAIEDYDVSGNIIAREVGAGTYSSTGPTLTRDTVYSSTNAGAKINCSGLQYVFVSLAKEDLATFGVLSAVNTWTGNNYFTTGNVGIGTASPSGSLHVVGSSANFMDRAGSAHLLLRSGNGTVSSPTGILSTNLLGRVSFQGYDGTQWTANSLSGVAAFATENWSTTARGSQLQFLTTPNTTAAAVERMTIDQAGNVGIGTTAPSSRLTVSDGTVRIDLSPFSGSTGYVGTQSNHPLGIITNNAEVIRATTDGRVGIGTTNPSGYDAKLAVFNGNFALTTTTNRLYLYYASATNHAYLSAATGGEILFSNGTASPSERMRIDTNGNLGVGTSGPDQRLVVSGNIQSGTTGSNGALYLGGPNVSFRSAYSANVLGIYTSNVEQLRIDSSGSVGIGTTAPASPLHVERNQAAETALFINNTNASGYSAVRIGPSDRGTNLDMLLYSSATASGIRAGSRPLLFESGAGTERMRMDVNGNFGVGVSPFCRLHVRSDVTGAAPAASGTTDAATIDRIQNNVVALDTGVMTNGNIWLQGRNTGNFATSYPILLNPNPGSGGTGALGFGTTAPRSIVHFNTASAGQFYFFQNSSGVGGTALTSTDTYPITIGNGFIGYGGLFLLPGRWGNATTVDSHNVLYLSGAQRNLSATASDIAFANWGYFTGVTAAAGHLGNATAQADAVKFNIRHTDNGGEFNQRLTFLARSATGTVVSALEIFSSGETVLPVVGQTDVNSVGFRGSPNNDLTGAYTLALTDAGRTVRKTSTTLRTVTIPADATVNFPLGTCIMLCNVVDGTNNSTTVGNLTVACAASGPTLVWLSGTTKNNRTSATNTQIAGGGSATLRKVAANLWTITGAGIS